MSVFEKCFLFLRNPRGGVEDLRSMQEAGFEGVFCNIGDYPPSDWEAVIRPRAQIYGLFCGPWLRTADGLEFDPNKLAFLLETADRWGSPLVCNSEKELDGSGDDLTTYIAEQIGDREAAISMEAWPFGAVDWTPIAHLPVLPQIFPAESDTAKNPDACREEWYRRGIRCVYLTFGSYGGMVPADFNLQAPYSIYTGDDCGYDYRAWSSTSTGYIGCREPEPEPPDGGDSVGIGIAPLCDEAWDGFTTSNPGKKWIEDNPKEWDACLKYWEGPVGVVAPINIETKFGNALVALTEIRRYAEGSHA